MDKYFESFYLSYEIVSSKNLEFILKSSEHLKYLEENDNNTWKHTDTSDYYFNQRPIGGERPFSILDLAISDIELTESLISHGLVCRETIDYIKDQHMEEYRQQIETASCFNNSSYSIFFSSEENTVAYIWLYYDKYSITEKDKFDICKFLNHFGEKYSLILIDWYEKLIVDLSIKENIMEYLNDTAGNKSIEAIQ